MPGKRIPQLDAIAGASTANDDNLVIYDTDAGTTKRILRSQLAAGLVGDLPYTPAGFIAATTVPTAIAEIASDLAAQGGAALIGNTPAGTIAATTVQGAINEIVSDLAASTGSSLVGFQQAGAGAAATTAQGKLRESVTPKDFGAVGDGTTDDSVPIAALASGLAAVGGKTATLAGKRYLTTTGVNFDNLNNVEFIGPGLITNGTDLFNFPADDYQRVIGQEYLAAFHKKALDAVSTLTNFRIKVFGDSRPAGNSQTGNFLWNAALREAARQRGYYRGAFENNAIGGSTIQNWTDTHIDTYLTGSNDPDLVVFCAGINDLYIPFGPATPEQVVSRLDAFLTKVRVTKGYSLSQLSIAVVVPVSAYNPSQGRDPRFIEPLRTGFKRMARKHQVCVIDGYGVAADGRNQRGLGYAADITAPEVIHQNNVGMIPILAQLIDAVLPDITPMHGGGFSMDSGSLYSPAQADLPATYPLGKSLYRATGGGWPVDGFVETTNFVDDIQVQLNYNTLNTNTQIWIRKGRANAWGSWVRVDPHTSVAAVTAASGFAVPGSAGMRTVRSGSGLVVADGYITMNTPGIVAANTVVATVASGQRPVNDSWYGSATVWNTTTFAQVLCRVLTGGNVEIMQATPINANRIWLNASWTT
jgi:lysophospholipase L1-like esterase